MSLLCSLPWVVFEVKRLDIGLGSLLDSQGENPSLQLAGKISILSGPECSKVIYDRKH